MENANSASINFESNQTDLPKYEDLIPMPLPQTNGVTIGQSQIELSVLNPSSNTIINNVNENNNSDNKYM